MQGRGSLGAEASGTAWLIRPPARRNGKELVLRVGEEKAV